MASSSSRVAVGRKRLTLEQRVEVIQLSNNAGKSTRKLAESFGCGKTQIIKILKNKDKILTAWTSNEGPATTKRVNTEKFGKINHLLWE